MPVHIPYRKVGGIAILYPEGRLTGLSAGPMKTAIQDLLEDGVRKFIINLRNVISIDSSFAGAINSIDLEVKRSDGLLMLTDAGFDVLPWLEKNSPRLIIYNNEDIALQKLGLTERERLKGNIAVVGASDISRELFKGITLYKGLIFHYFDDALRSTDKVIELNPKGILLNIENGSIAVEPMRRWRFGHTTKMTPIIIFGPTSMKRMAPAMISEGANDYIEVTFDGAEILNFMKTLDFRNILAKKLDMILEDTYKDFDFKP